MSQVLVSPASRSPRLDTILMVEDHIKKYDGEFTKYKLWQALPKKMMYQTFCTIFDYVLASGKISVDAEGKIGWIFYPESARYWASRTDLAWKKPSIIQQNSANAALSRKKSGSHDGYSHHLKLYSKNLTKSIS